MLFKSDSPIINTISDAEYLADWPSRYFDIQDINRREACLKQYLKEHPESSEDKRRLALLQTRYGPRAKKDRGDLFVKSFMMIQIAYNNRLSESDFIKREKEIRRDYTDLCVLDCERDALLFKEWENFAGLYLSTCASHEYRSTLFGTITLKDEVVAAKIASEIDTVTRLVPRVFHFEEECRQLREIFVRAYSKALQNGAALWEGYMENHV
ncbi:MAG: hypothetical protein IJT16_11655 [Lachnospiraceae bacterium]|nr:hypothetical protein [Lachnospiraceae bacterium]